MPDRIRWARARTGAWHAFGHSLARISVCGMLRGAVARQRRTRSARLCGLCRRVLCSAYYVREAR